MGTNDVELAAGGVRLACVPDSITHPTLSCCHSLTHSRTWVPEVILSRSKPFAPFRSPPPLSLSMFPVSRDFSLADAWLHSCVVKSRLTSPIVTHTASSKCQARHTRAPATDYVHLRQFRSCFLHASHWLPKY